MFLLLFQIEMRIVIGIMGRANEKEMIVYGFGLFQIYRDNEFGL
jgi:hypothetical protein